MESTGKIQRTTKIGIYMSILLVIYRCTYKNKKLSQYSFTTTRLLRCIGFSK